MEQNITALNERFAIQGEISFSDIGGGFMVADIDNEHCTASIALQGAHLLSWTPKNEQPVIWMSPDALFTKGKSIRGGIPVCWPWFGAHVNESSFPAHGFARTSSWQVITTDSLEDGGSHISFRLDTSGDSPLWPHITTCKLDIKLGKTLEMALTTDNNGDKPVTIGQALHTYFAVGDIRSTTVHGLDGRPYLDKPDGFRRKLQHGAISFSTETDRIYLETTDECLIEDQTLNRIIHIEKSGSASTIVWNPWQKRAEQMGDLGNDGYLNMLCVESANAADDVATINSGCSRTLKVHYSITKPS